MRSTFRIRPARVLLGMGALWLLVAGQCSGPANVPPSLSSVPDRSTPMGETIDVPVSIVDENASTVVVSAASNDPTLVADADIEVLGAGSDRTVRLTPSPLGTGHAVITVTARDVEGLEDEASFALEVRLPFQAELPKLTASDGGSSDEFGYSVGIDGDYAIAGAPNDDVSGADDGSAYVFERSGDAWVEVAKLTASDGASSDFFGHAVAIDGDTALVGAPEHDLAGPDAGAAYVFERLDGVWTEVAKLTASDAEASSEFGTHVAIHEDYAIVSADRTDVGTFTDAGAAYVFERSGSSWTEVAKLTASDAAAFDIFGTAVAIRGDYAIVGAYADDLSATNEGSAYVFERAGSTWLEVDKLTASDAADGDFFGWSVAIDGDYAFVGAIRHDLVFTHEGSAYVFERTGSGWVEMDKLTASDAADGDLFGQSVAIRGDYAVVGSRLDDVTGIAEGSAYVFKRSGSAWVEVEKLVASDASDNEYFGFSVSLDDDYAIAGAYWDAVSFSMQGSAYVFRK